jgi:NAD(P)-dependent dehydrogenase (short-subunit alcohol dehydrogenase family)
VTELRFDHAVAIVTGAGGGLGRQYALELARRRASVVVNDLGPNTDGGGTSLADGVAAEIRAAGGTAIASHASVATADGGQAVVDAAVEEFGRIDIAVNNAGILRPQAFADLDFDVLEAVLAVHLKGAFHVTRAAYRHMVPQGGGAIVNTTSGAVFGVAGQANYASAKGGIIGLTRVLAAEGAAHGVRANAVMPIAATPMTDGFFPDGLDKLLDSAFVAQLVSWLAHPACGTTGELFSVGGGHIGRVFLGETAGWTQPDPALHTAEAIRDNFDLVVDTAGYTVPASFEEEMGLTVAAITNSVPTR